MSDQKPREIAAKVLQRTAARGDYIENVLEKALAETHLSPPDRGLCQELVYGVVRRQATLDWLIARKTTGRTQKPMLQTLLRLGLYQIFWLDRIPPHAAVNETVEQARQSGFGPQSGFVNAVLRGYLREVDSTRQSLAELKTTAPHIGYSHPEWLVQRWQKLWGTEKTAQLMERNNTSPKTFARVNTLKFRQAPTDAQPGPPKTARHPFYEKFPKNTGELLEQWRTENVEYDFVRRDWFDDNLVFELKSHPPLQKLTSFQQGLFYVQDPSTLLAACELDPQPGETVLDLCAAPGGKTAYIAQLMEDRGKIVAHDTAPERLKLIEENCARLGVTCAEIVASNFPLRPAHFDRILIDAPCSNTGVMRRRVDLRWRIRPEEIGRLQATQLDLMRQAAALLKPGGTLVYSTCSLEPEENEQVLEQFLREMPTFTLEHQQALLPFADDVDGAFVGQLVLKK